MANKDITETGVRSVLETMGIPSSFQGFKENAIGRAEAAATIGSSMVGTMAGMGGSVFEAARGGDMRAQLDTYRQIQEAMTYTPRTQGGLERVQQIGELFEPVGQLYEQYGEAVGESTGRPLLGEYAEEFVDPLFFLGGIGGIPKRAGRIADAAEDMPRFAENVASQTTQRSNTVGTAVKASNYLDEIGAEGKTLDYGAGLGENAKAIKADETFEPFPQGEFNPTYTDPAQVPANSYGRIVSTNVLNVLPPDIRAEAVQTIGKALEPGGTALIQTWDVGAAKAGMKSKKATIVPDEENAFTTSTGSYQKGFSKQELQEYIANTLGPGYLIEPVPNKAGISGTAVTVKKIADPTIQVDLGIPEARLNEIAEQAIRAYHGSAANFDKFDLDFIGTGEGAQAYGYGLYFAEVEDIGVGYKEALSQPRVLLDNKPLGDVYTADIREGFKGFYNGIVDRQIEEYADMFADAARDAGLDDADAFGAALGYLEASKAQIMQTGSDKAIDAKAADALMKIKNEFSEVGLDSQLYFDLEDTINDIDSIIANIGQGGGNKADFDYVVNNYLEPRQKALYEEYFADKIKFDEPEGVMYEVNIKASKDELLDWDKPFSEQPKKVQEAITKILPQKQASFESMSKEDLRGLLQRIDPNGVYSDEASLREFGELPTKQDFLDSIETMEENDPGSVTSYLTEGITPDQSGRTIYERLVTRLGGGDRLDNRNKPSAIASERLNELGIKGIRYDDGLSRGKEGGTSNFVIFDPRIIDIAKKYGVAIPVAGAILMQSEGEQSTQPEA